jgi:hypothetical protein
MKHNGDLGGCCYYAIVMATVISALVTIPATEVEANPVPRGK